jgi:hypothetical protein
VVLYRILFFQAEMKKHWQAESVEGRHSDWNTHFPDEDSMDSDHDLPVAD